jgi:hypothetical protein
MSVNDSWSRWKPDAERAFREHDPLREPYASMSRAEILARMRQARGGREWESLREFLIDKCTKEELEYDRFLALLAQEGGLRREELCFLSEVAGMATRLIPSPGRPGTRPPSADGGSPAGSS